MLPLHLMKYNVRPLLLQKTSVGWPLLLINTSPWCGGRARLQQATRAGRIWCGETPQRVSAV